MPLVDDDAASRVTETVDHEHYETAAVIPPEEAAELVAVMQVESVQELDEDHEAIHLITFMRNPGEFHDALHNGPELEAIRYLSESQGFTCKVKGISVFVHPDQFNYVRTKIINKGDDLRPYHVIASDTYLPQVYLAARRLRSKLNVRPKSDEMFAQLKISNGPTPIRVVSGGEADTLITIHKTFYDLMPERYRRQVPSVTNSTTEATGGMNPRRRVPNSL